MKYTFTTQAKERVTIDRSLLTGKVKVTIDGKQVGPSMRGMRGATGAFYPIKSGTLEVRSSLFEMVPRVWYKEDWVDLIAPLKPLQYVLIGLPFVTAAFSTFGQLSGIVVGLLGVLLCLVIMYSQSPLNKRVLFCGLIALIAPVLGIAVTIGLSMAMGGSPQ
ncbi:MAG: hypothetical protein M1434_08670 [Chloroflexi bacterium]|nr:hypothetical protein [Chloroflexota bacterium]MCL5274802.1 hypothetical protein [Chloroflexota bacterium]